MEELQELWWQEAERNRVLPLMAGFSVIYGILPPLPTQTRFTFAGDVQNVNWGMIPRIYGRSYSIEADLVVPESEERRASSSRWPTSSAGFGLWVDGDGILRHTYSLLGVDTYKQASSSPLPVRRRAREDAVRVGRRTSLGAAGTSRSSSTTKQVGEG